MTIYFVLLALSAVIGIPVCGPYKKRSNRRGAIYCAIFGAIFIVLFGVRFCVGIDYKLYASNFYDVNFMDYQQMGDYQREMGVLFIVKLVELFTFDYVPCFMVLGFFIYIPIMVYAAKYSDNPWIGVFAFLSFGVYFNSLNFMRQTIAAIICGFAFKYAEKGNFFRFLITVLISAAFHRSSLIIIPCYLLVYISMNLTSLILALLTSVSAFILSEDIVQIVSNYITFYKSYSVSISQNTAKGLNPMYTIMYAVIFIFAFILKDKIDAPGKEKNILLWSSYAAFFFELIGIKYAIISRMALLFFFPVMFILVPKIFIAVSEILKEKLNGKRGQIASIGVSAVMLIAMCVNYSMLLDRNYNGVVPYRTIQERG